MKHYKWKSLLLMSVLAVSLTGCADFQNTTVPALTSAPEMTKEPSETQAPEITIAPLVTQTPEIPEAPQITEEPVVTAVPVQIPWEEELSGAAVAQMDLLLMNLTTPEYANEAIFVLFSEEWKQAMMPLEGAGYKYYSRELADTTIYIKTGYDEQLQSNTTIWQKSSEGIQLLRQNENSIQSVVTDIQDGAYQGAFESWYCEADTGNVIQESGTFDAGIPIGTYTAKVRFGEKQTDIMSLWFMKEDMEMSTYEGYFEENGSLTVATSVPEGKDFSFVKETLQLPTCP